MEARHGSDRIVQSDSWMIQNPLKLRRCFAVSSNSRMCEATHVDRIESSEEGGPGPECRTGNSKMVRGGHLRHFKALSPDRPG
jgi:hypothetical protein